MMILHPFSRYGMAYLMHKENLDNIENLTLDMIIKHIEHGLNHFRLKPMNTLDSEVLNFEFINLQKGDKDNGIYLSPCIITTDKKASQYCWTAINELLNKIIENKSIILTNFSKDEINSETVKFLFDSKDKITMGISPIAGELNNGTKSKKNYVGSIAEKSFCAITNTTPIKPYLAFREKGGQYTPTTIIPDLELSDLIVFIQFYEIMLNSIIDQNKLLTKKVYKKDGVKPKYSRPLIYNGNFPFAPYNSQFGIVSLLGAIGRWSKEAGYIEQGQKVLESLKNRPLYLIQYSHAQSVTINHFIIELAKDNKLSEIVFAIQNSQLLHPFDEKDPKDKKGVESRKDVFYLFCNRFLQLFNSASFSDFLSVRAEYSYKLIELFNIFFEKQMSIRKEIVHSAKKLGLWLNYIAYKVGSMESENQKKPEKLKDFKAKVLVELESSVFGARKHAEVLNVIVRAGRLSGMDAPSESDIFLEAVLTEEISLDDAKSMLMAYARIRNRIEEKSTIEAVIENPEEDDFIDEDTSEQN